MLDSYIEQLGQKQCTKYAVFIVYKDKNSEAKKMSLYSWLFTNSETEDDLLRAVDMPLLREKACRDLGETCEVTYIKGLRHWTYAILLSYSYPWVRLQDAERWLSGLAETLGYAAEIDTTNDREVFLSIFR